MRHAFMAGLAIGTCITLSHGVPAIKADLTEFDVGVIMEGTKEKVRHEFVVTNTGDSVLRIKDVRAG